MDKQIWIGTNWKMTKDLEESISYSKALLNLNRKLKENIQLFIIPSYPFISQVKELVKESTIKVGAQNMHWEDVGAYTGEVSPKMLKDLHIDLVELGHSERRQYYNENDIDINKKVKSALRHNIKPLVCIGENLEEKSFGLSKEVLSSQLKVCLSEVSIDDISKVIIAYEPVWAIGENGIPADEDYVDMVHNYLRDQLINMYGEIGNQVTLLYGGSVNTDNYLKYIELANIDGLFIGRAAWDMESFEEILLTLNDKF